MLSLPYPQYPCEGCVCVCVDVRSRISTALQRSQKKAHGKQGICPNLNRGNLFCQESSVLFPHEFVPHTQNEGAMRLRPGCHAPGAHTGQGQVHVFLGHVLARHLKVADAGPSLPTTQACSPSPHSGLSSAPPCLHPGSLPRTQGQPSCH